MIIKFKLDDYYDICDEYERIFELAEPIEIEDENNNCLITTGKRIVIPQIHKSFREAEWYWKDEAAESPDTVDDEDECDNADEYEIQGSVYVSYPENEKDPNKYISFVTGELSYFVQGYCETEGLDIDPEELDCYIDTEEFVDKSTLKAVLDE